MSTPDPHRYRWYWALRPIRGQWGLDLDKWLVRKLGFSAFLGQVALARHLPWQPALLLETIGAKSGEVRTAVLPYVKHAGAYLIFGSLAGGEKHPAWVINLKAHPRARITVKRRPIAVSARIAQGAEREELLAVMRAERPHVDEYSARAATFGREIALVVLEPAAESR